MSDSAALPGRFGRLAELRRLALPVSLITVFVVFSLTTTTFLTAANLASVLVNNIALLAIVAIGMTLVVAAGGIDLSVGTSLDASSLAFVSLVLSGQPTTVAAAGGLAAALSVGLFNAFLISVLRIAPFLATLGTLFIGRSAQQLLTGGGNPIYIPASSQPTGFAALGHGDLFGVPLPLMLLAALALASAFLITATAFGRAVVAIGIQPVVARYSGLRVRLTVATVYITASLVVAVAGLILSSTVSVYVPYSGNAFLLNAVGATFIGTSLDREGRPNIAGTLLGVSLLGIVANGLLLVGLNYYWQQVGTGLLIFLVLALSFATRPTN